MANAKTTGRRQAPSSNGEAPTLAVESVTPPQRKGRPGGVAFTAEQMKQLADAIKNGWTGDGQTYKSRQKANLRVTRYKRALIHHGFYRETKEIRSRTWDDDGGAKLALIDAATAKASA
jgi:hypothetical protein